MLGQYDHVEFAKIDMLDELEPTTIEDVRDLNLGSLSQLLLFPVNGAEVRKDLVDDIHSVSGASPLMVIVPVTLSAVLHESGKDFRGTLAAIQQAAQKGLSEFPSDLQSNAQAFSTFGGPDLVFLCTARLPSDIVSISRWIDELRLWSVGKVSKVNSVGHAFSSVAPMLAFRHGRPSAFSSHAFRSDEDRAGLRLRFRMRVDCGHRLDAMKRVRDASKDRIEFDEQPWSKYVVEGSIHSFRDIVNVSEKVFFDRAWRTRNLVDTETSLMLPGFENFDLMDRQPLEPANTSGWDMKSEVIDELNDIHDRIEAFSTEFLRPPQSTELIGLYHAFRSCFFRHELFTAGRDLLPFFRQLSFALQLHEQWNTFFAKTSKQPGYVDTARNKFNAEIGRLLNYAGRSVRNRIDFRLMPREMSFPHTLDDGACKLVGAYSTAVFAGWELFNRSSTDSEARQRISSEAKVPARDQCDADSFGVCLSSGVQGKVVCTEIFRSFRRFIEDQPDSPTWNARLLLVDISGKGLLRPEQSFVHFFHEVAEISDWIESERCGRLRSIFHDWVRKVAATYIVDIAFPLDDEFESKRTRSYVYDRYARALLQVSLFKKLRVNNERDVSKRLSTLHPEDYVDFVTNAFLDLIDSVIHSDSRTDSMVREVITNSKDPIPAFESTFYRPANAYRNSFTKKVEQLKRFLREILADTGMWAALYAMPHSPVYGLSDEERIVHVNYIFKSILLIWEESSAPNLKLPQERANILLRWQFQLMAVIDRNRFVSRDKWVDYVASNIAREISRLNRDWGCDIDKSEVYALTDRLYADGSELVVYYMDVVAERLQDFDVYGGSQRSLGFPVPSQLGAPLQSIFYEFSQVWLDAIHCEHENDLRKQAVMRKKLDISRINFIHALWAKSGRIRYSQALEYVDHIKGEVNGSKN